MTGVTDTELAFLSGSPVRVSILERLTTVVAQPSELVDHTGVSRTTVHRTLSELVDRNWARRVDGGYTATGAGALALDVYRTARTRFRTLERVEPVLSELDAPLEGEIGLSWLETAAVETATEGNPQRPLEWYVDRLEAVDGDRLRGVTPIVSRQFMTAHAPIVFGGTPTALVVGEEAFRAVREQYPEKLRESIALEGYELSVAAAEPSMGITLYGEHVFLGAYEEGRLLAVVDSTDDRLRSWARTRYCRYADDARPAEELVGRPDRVDR
ncbi:helix-turn-helix transcriptional regulator [Natrononativus amylolyticus]|uniref:helix-turn-helix transcriptional regulator n=1 Tax=Natrononativus amylolyticus TaxID=2963434 RepID=UPI0020CEFA6D|nr:helix-turn-helix domain-containing protein [Natrononativus amylolyticus]